MRAAAKGKSQHMCRQPTELVAVTFLAGQMAVSSMVERPVAAAAIKGRM
jgi:hypothetical protein